MMISQYTRFLASSGLALLFSITASAAVLSELEQVEFPEEFTTQTKIASAINGIVKAEHFHQVPLDDQLSEKIMDRYIEQLDPSKSFFLQEDIDTIKTLRHEFDDYINYGFFGPTYSIFEIYRSRVNQRIEFALARLDQPFDFTIDEDFLLDREDADWAQDIEQLDDYWRKRIKNDIINLSLAKKPDNEIKATLKNRYIHIARRTGQFKSEDVFQSFINSYLTSIEPYTFYHSPRGAENFKIQMRLSLEGVGAMLENDDEHTVVRRIIPGGPAALSGKLDAGDRIIGVGQGNEDIVDVVGWRLDDVVMLIRGPKASVVNLEVLPAENGLDGEPEIIAIVRDEIKLEEQAAGKQIIDIETVDGAARIGVIQLPSFYVDFDGKIANDPNYRSTTRDVKKLLAELEHENTDGLIMDLRGNRGGALGEAITLAGLFISKGPIVQVKFTDGFHVDRDPDPRLVYADPLVVLVDRDSASAAEIFAGAIQDYNRGLILGETTFGKGTVQEMVNLNQRFPDADVDLGELRFTIAQFFRVNGDSTQHRGVIPDIEWHLGYNDNQSGDATASGGADDESGERSNENAIPWRQIGKAIFTPYQPKADPVVMARIISEHQTRVADNPEFVYVGKSNAINRIFRKMKTISLSAEKRQQLRQFRDQQRLDLENAKRTGLGKKALPTIELLDAELAQGNDSSDVGNSIGNQPDAFLVEGARILLDFERYTNLPEKAELPAKLGQNTDSQGSSYQ